MASTSTTNTNDTLIKHTVADRLRAEIANGGLQPGVRIVEGKWARKFGVAQGSIREAINLLAQEGFVTKSSRHSARVVNLTESDVLQIYEVRGSLEGLAARLLAQRPETVGPLEEAVAAMRRASREGNPRELIDADLRFHMELCRLSNNTYVLEYARKVLLPQFAFARIRVLSSGQGTGIWDKDLEAHQRIVDLVKEGQGEVAEQYVKHAMARFALTSYSSWEKKETEPQPRRRKAPGRK